MSFGTFLAIAAITLFALGAYVAHRASGPARKRVRDLEEAEAAQKARDENEGRERNRRTIAKQELQGFIEDILQGRIDPNRELGCGYRNDASKQYPAIHLLIQNLRDVEDLKVTSKELNGARQAYRKNITLLQGQLDDLHKAIGTYTK
jgi:hypothetical protein